MATLVAFGLAWIVGLGVGRASLRSAWRTLPGTLRLGLGWAVGSALAGMTTFGAIALTPGHRGLASGATLTLVGLVAWLIPIPIDPASTGLDEPTRGRASRVAWWLGSLGFFGVLIIWLGRVLDLGAGSAIGGWDAWAIWNLRARAFYLGPEDWTRGFDPVIGWSHPEYPSLVPSLVVWGWLPAGRCVAASPVLVALTTQVGLLLLLVGFLQAGSPRSPWPWAFGAYFATIPLEWSQLIAWQYADRPLSFFFLAGLGSLFLFIRGGRRGWLPLAGLFWGAAAFTKDEGKAALVLLGIGAAFATACGLSHGAKVRSVLANLALLTLGLTPGLASLAIQKHFDPAPSNLIARMTLAPLTDASRTGQIVRFLLDQWTDPACGWLWWGSSLTLATLFPWLRKRDLVLLWVFPIAQLVIYLLVFQLTPEDLTWHLDSALPRLLFHIGPTTCLAAGSLILEAESRSPMGPGNRGSKRRGQPR